MRYTQFIWSTNFIAEYNAAGKKNKLGHTMVSDWTEEEKHGLLMSEEEMKARSLNAELSCTSFSGECLSKS